MKHSKVLPQDLLEDRENNYTLRLLELKRVEEEQQKHFLYAPAKGKILQRFIDFAGPITAATPIFVMKASARPWIVTAQLTEREINVVRMNDTVRIHFQGIPETPFVGMVQKIALQTDEDSMLEIEIALEKSAPFLRAGMNAMVLIETSVQHSGYPVPLSAFLHIKQNKAMLFLFEKESKTAKKLEVEFKLIKGTDAIVLTDLSEFDGIIVAGQYNLKNGSLVQVIRD